MEEQEIKDLYDANPNMTLVELATLTGRTIGELKKILLDQ